MNEFSSSVAASLAEFVSSETGVDSVDETQDLIDSGILDSLLVMSVVAFVENRFSITMSATVDKPVVDNGQVVPGRVAPLFLRADHRLVDAYQMRAFLETLTAGFKQPELLESTDADIRNAA